MDMTELLNVITDHVINVIKQEQQEPVLFITGEVVQVNPLQIKINEIALFLLSTALCHSLSFLHPFIFKI